MSDPRRAEGPAVWASIDEALQSYFATIVRPGMPREIALETRRAFYAGAGAALALAMEAWDNDDAGRVLRLSQEVRTFTKLYREGVV